MGRHEPVEVAGDDRLREFRSGVACDQASNAEYDHERTDDREGRAVDTDEGPRVEDAPGLAFRPAVRASPEVGGEGDSVGEGNEPKSSVRPPPAMGWLLTAVARTYTGEPYSLADRPVS